MVKWTEVSAYSGLPVEEDAPTNATGVAVAGTGDDSSVVVMKKKKKKTFLDARTKEYKEHQKRLEASRARREERRKAASKINEGQLDEREKGIDQLPRQFLNPDKEVMILKKGKVIVIDKKDKDKYMRQGWDLAEKQIQKEDKEKVAQLKTKLSKEKDTDALEAQITDLKGQIALLKTQLENEKNATVKPEPNPETGEVPLTVGVAYKHLRDKMKKEEEKKDNKKTAVGSKANKVDTKPEVEFDK